MLSEAQGLRQVDGTSGYPVHPVEAHTQLGVAHPAAAPAQSRQDPSKLAAIDQEIIGPLDLRLQPERLQLQRNPHRRSEGQRSRCRRLLWPGNGRTEPHTTRRRLPHPALLPMAMALLLRQQRQRRLGARQKPALQLQFRAGAHRQHPQPPSQRLIRRQPPQGGGNRSSLQS